MTAPVEARGLVKRFGEIVAVDRRRSHRRGGRRLRLPRPERGRQDDDAADAARPDPPERRDRTALRPRPAARGARALEGVAGFVEGPRFYPYSERPQEPGVARRLRPARCRADGDRRRARGRSSCATARRTASAATRTGCGSGSGSRRRCCASRACSSSTSPRPGSTRPGCATCAPSSAGSPTRE